MSSTITTDRDFNFDDGSIDASRISVVAGRDINFNLDSSLSFEVANFTLEAGRNLQIADSLDVLGPASLTAMGAISVGGDLTLTLGSGGNVSGNLLVQKVLRETRQSTERLTFLSTPRTVAMSPAAGTSRSQRVII